MIQTKDNGSYHEVTKVFAGGIVQQEVIKIWSTDADDWVYEALGEATGALPLTFHADGSALVDYQIWGNVGGIGLQTKNLFNKNAIEYPAYIRAAGTINTTSGANGYAISDYIPVSAGDYVAHGLQSRGNLPHIAVYDENQELVRTVQIISNEDLNLTIGNDEKYVRLSVRMAGDEYQTAMFTRGATAPETFVPFGYKLDMVSRTENLFDKNDPDVLIGYEIVGYQISKNDSWFVTGYIPVNGLESYSKSNLSAVILFYDENKRFLNRKDSFPLNDSNAKFIRMNGLLTNINTAMLNEGSTALPYEPYSNTATPIYIGSDPLGEDEYVDYQEGKVYRRTENEFDKDNAAVYNAYIDYNYSKWIKIESGAKTVKIPCLPQTQYTLSVPSELSVFRIAESANSDIEPTTGSGSAISIITKNDNSKYTFTTAQNTQCLIFQGNGALLDEWFNGLMLVKGDTAPETYTPYLQPTDPPVALPALPTCEGETVVDYDDTPAPSSVEIKYNKGW